MNYDYHDMIIGTELGLTQDRVTLILMEYFGFHVVVLILF
jgi:hypothetical protein